MFLGFLFIFELGCLICGLSSSSIVLIIGRVISGIGSSGIMNGALTMVAVSTPLEKRPALMGILMACAQLGLIIGPLVGGALTEYTTWRWCKFPLTSSPALALLTLFKAFTSTSPSAPSLQFSFFSSISLTVESELKGPRCISSGRSST